MPSVTIYLTNETYAALLTSAKNHSNTFSTEAAHILTTNLIKKKMSSPKKAPEA